MAKKLKSLNPIIGTGYKTLSKIKDGEDGNIENFPDTLPKIPRLSYKRLGVSGLEIGWEFEDKIYYTYELYGSTTKGFETSEENLMFQGLASSYFYEAKPGEKWYFKARAKNTHGRYTEFSSELVTYTVKLDNLGEYVEGGSINGALIENATINNAHIKDLHADKITAGVLDADRIGANSITANKIEANAITSEKIQANAITTGKIQANAITTDKLAANIIASNHIQAGAITSGHIQSGTIESGHIKAGTIVSDHIQANTIQSEHIQTGAITAGSGIIADGAIGSAQISSLDAAKIEAGTIDTSKVTIQGADGHLRLKGNRMQVFQGTGNQARERVSLGDVNGNGSVYGLRVRGADGTTILLDENGVKSEGITDGAITNDKISDDANIDGAKLNINSVVNKINEDGTETIQGTKIEVDGTTLNTKLSTITTKQTEDSERITQAQSQITANTNAIKLKVDEQTYTTDKKDMTSKLEKNTSEISAMKGQIALKVEQTDIENAKSEMEGVLDSKLDTTKAEIKVTTDAISQNVSNLSQTVSTKADGSTVTTLSNKVGSLETSVNGISGKITNLEKTTTTLGGQVSNAQNTANSAISKADNAQSTANNANSTANTNKNNITNLQGEVSTVKSDIASLEVTTSGISQKVSSVESTTATLTTKVTNAQNTANSAQSTANSANANATNALNTANSTNSKIDNLNISDRNLVKNSDMFITTGSNTNKCTMSDDFSQLFNNNKGKKLSISIEVNATNALSTNTSGSKRLGCELTVTYSDDTKGYFGAWQSLTDKALNLNKKRINNTYTIPNKDIKSVSTCGLYIQGLTSGTVKIGKPKYQISDKSSDWTPAPEDIDNAINAVDGKLTTLQGEYNTTKSQVATLETNLDGITQRVSSTESTTSSLTSQMNNKENKNDRVIYAKGNGNDAPNNSQVKVGSNTLVNGHGRGLNIVALNPTTLTQYYKGTFDTYGGDNYRTQFAEKIQELNNGNYIIVVTSHDSACLNYDTVCNALYLIGGSAPNTSISSYREAYALIGKSKLGKGNGLEMYIPETATDARVAEVSVKVSDQGALLGVNSNNSESKIDTLTTRVSTAESKLTKDSLTTTIGNHYTTSTDVNGIVTSKGYQTESEVQQTVNGLQVKVSQSGGYNLLRNSGFKKDSLHWGTQNHNSPTGGTISYLEHTAEWGFPDINVKCCQIRLSGQTSKEYGITQTFNTTKGKKYTISFYYAGHRVPKANMIIRGTTSSSGSWLTSKNFVPTSKNGGNASIDNWALFTHTFTAMLNSHTLNIVINDANNDGYMWIAQPMIEEGELHNPYSPHPSEIYDGVTTIDKDGVTVTASNVKSKTNMSANGFKITKTDTNEDVFKVNSDGTLYMKGQITVTGGSVPTSNLSGTISSNQLNSSITSDINNAKNNASSALSTANTASTNATNALNTANSVNSTVDSNKGNWSNAYNRVKEWASGAVTGTTNINGGMIATDTITAKQMAIGDFNNYSQLAKGKNLVSRYGTANWTEGTNGHSYWQTTNAYFPFTVNETLNPFKAGDKIQIKFDAYTPSTRNVSVGVWFYSDTAASTHIGDVTTNVSCSSSWGTKTVNLTLPTGNTYVQNAKSIAILINNGSSGERIEVRNATVNRLVAGDLIVNGTITTDHIHTNGLNANVIKAGIISADRLDANTIVSKVNGGTTEINGNRIQTGTLSASKITAGTLDASKVNVTNLNASNITSGKLSANYIDVNNLKVNGSLISGQINGVGGIKFADGAIISSYDSQVPGYKGIRISAPSIKLGDKVDIHSAIMYGNVVGRNNTSSATTTWTMSGTGALSCASANLSGTLNVNGVIYGMNNLALARGSVYIPIFGSSGNFDYIEGGRGMIAFADTGPIHFLYNGTKSSFIAGGSVFLPHAGTVNCDHFRLGAGIMASPSSGSFHFLTANGATSPLYAGILYSATRMSLDEPMVVSSNSVFDKINSIDVIETKDGLRLYNPIQTTKAIDKSTEVVKTEYDEDKNEINTSIDYTSAIATLWKAVQELKQENNELKEIIKDIHSK